jgi:hypothetical protein
VDEDDFLIATVELFDAHTGTGLAWYSDDEGIRRSVRFAEDTCDSTYVYATSANINWCYTYDGYLPISQMKEGVEIVIGEVDEQDTVMMWALKSELDRQLLEARTTSYDIYDNGFRIWSGGLTSRGEIHSFDGPLPKEFTERMYIEMFERGDEEYPSGFERLSDTETIAVWLRMKQANWVSPPVRGFIAA